MKKMVKVFLAVASVAYVGTFISCQSTKVVAADYSPAAVISVYGNSNLPWYLDPKDKTSEDDGESGGMLSGLVNRALGANNPEVQTVQERIDYAADALNRGLQEKGGIAIIDHSVIENTPVFKSNGNSFFSDIGDEVPADGYKVIGARSGKRNRDLAKQTGAKSTIYATFKFQKQKLEEGIIGKLAAARVTMTIYIANERGRTVWSKEYYAISTKSVTYKNGKWDRQGVCDLFPDTINAVVNQFIFDYVGTLQPTATEETASETTEVSADTTTATPIAIPTTVKKNNDAATTDDATTPTDSSATSTTNTSTTTDNTTPAVTTEPEIETVAQ